MGTEGNGGAKLGLFGGLQAQVGQQLREGAATAQQVAERIIARLDVIAEAVIQANKTETERAFESKKVAANSSAKVGESRVGYMSVIEHVSIVTDGATTVDIHVGTTGAEGFRKRITTAAAESVSGALDSYNIPEGAPVFAVVGANAARVNVQLKREKVY